MRVMAKGYRFTISYILLSLAVIAGFIRMEILANEAIVASCEAAEEAKQTVEDIIIALAETSEDPTNPELVKRREFILSRIEREDCHG